jgi:hypothetical protein
MPLPYDPQRIALYQPEQRATVFAPGVAYSNLALAVEAARLAYIRVERGVVEQKRLRDALAVVGFTVVSDFHDADMSAQGFGAFRPADGLALVAFRGTQADDLSDLATDLNAAPVAWPEAGGRVHAGFAAATRALRTVVWDWLGSAARARSGLILTGHSLGGAMATLAASIWRPTELITLGSPRVGDARFRESVATVPGARLVNCCDVVTELPPELPAYVHVRAPLYINADGQLLNDPSAATIAADRRTARAEYLKKHAFRRGAVLVRDLADHAPINYLRALL